MSETARGLDDDRLKRLVHDLEAIVRRELPWYDGNQHDPSIALIELLAFLGDTLAEYQSRLAGETYLETRSRLLVTIGASPWREVASLESSGPGDHVYVVDRGAGAWVAATYRTGAGGNVATVTIRWPPAPPLALEIQAGPGRISFAPPRRTWRDCLARLFGGRR